MKPIYVDPSLFFQIGQNYEVDTRSSIAFDYFLSVSRLKRGIKNDYNSSKNQASKTGTLTYMKGYRNLQLCVLA